MGFLEMPTVLIKDKWIPEQFQDLVRNYKPKSRLGELIMRCLPSLPLDEAQELFDRLVSTLVIESSLALRVFRWDGGVEDYGVVSTKVITTAGVNNLCSVYAGGGTSFASFKYHGLGTNNTAESSADTALGTELTTQYNPDSTRATGTTTNSTNTFQSVATNTVDATAAVTEHGLFSATSAGTLWDRSIFSTINLASGDGIQSTYTGTLSAGG